MKAMNVARSVKNNDSFKKNIILLRTQLVALSEILFNFYTDTLIKINSSNCDETKKTSDHVVNMR